MFANILLECAPNLQARRRWTLLLSLALQMSAVSLILLYPLLHPERLPFISTVPKIALRAPTYVTVVPAGNAGFRPNPISQLQWPQQLNIRRSTASRIDQMNDTPPGTPPFFGLEGSSANPGIPWNILETNGARVVAAVPTATSPKFFHSHLEEGRLLQKIQPIYPPPAKLAHIQGEVVLTALIARDGTVEGLRAISGHPLLIPAALQAVSQWRYKPYILNGSATEVETTIRVNFRLEE
jgi:periplasmic protein TonB